VLTFVGVIHTLRPFSGL